MKALIVLANGMVFEGESFGAEGTRVGEVVFSTAMAGYEETLTDPSYYGLPHDWQLRRDGRGR